MRSRWCDLCRNGSYRNRFDKGLDEGEIMIQETHTITIPIYRNRDGWHTCRLTREKQCQFLGFRNFGQTPVCMKGENHDLDYYNGDTLVYIEPDCGMVVKNVVIGKSKKETGKNQSKLF
jgi:hypothetical protein